MLWSIGGLAVIKERKMAARKWWQLASRVNLGASLSYYRAFAFAFEKWVRTILSLGSFLDLKWLDSRYRFTWVMAHAWEFNQGTLEVSDGWEIKKGHQQRMYTERWCGLYTKPPLHGVFPNIYASQAISYFCVCWDMERFLKVTLPMKGSHLSVAKNQWVE